MSNWLQEVLKAQETGILDLCCRGIGDKEAKALVTELKEYPNITILRLNHNDLKYKGVKALAKGLKDTSVTSLDLSNNKIGYEGAKVLAEKLKYTNITTLHLASNNLGYEEAKVLAEKLKYTNITTFHLASNNLGYEEAKVLAEELKYTKITTLYLNNNKIGHEGAKALAAVLKYTKITTLSLISNKIGDEGAKALAEELRDTNITTLSLISNKIGYEGAKALAEGLKYTNITTLYLNRNNLGYAGATALAEGLKYTSITTLYLGSNNLGDEGAKVLAEKLKYTNIATLYLLNNKIGDEGAKALAAVINDTNIVTLYLHYNQCSQKILSDIDGKIKHKIKEIDDKLRTLFDKDGVIGDFIKNDKPGTLKLNTANLKDSDAVKAFLKQYINAIEDITFNNATQSRFIHLVNNYYNCTKEDAEGAVDYMQRQFGEFVGRELECSLEMKIAILVQCKIAGLSEAVRELLFNRECLYLPGTENTKPKLPPYVLVLMKKYHFLPEKWEGDQEEVTKDMVEEYNDFEKSLYTSSSSTPLDLETIVMRLQNSPNLIGISDCNSASVEDPTDSPGIETFLSGISNYSASVEDPTGPVSNDIELLANI